MKETEYYSERKKGIIGTVVFHTIILILLIFLGFFTPLPLPGEEGILVNFGDTENGLGDREPAPARKQQQTPPPPQPEEKKVTPTPVKQTPPPPVSQPKPEPAKEVAMTQDYEKTVAIDAAEKKKREEEKKRQEELDAKKRIEQEQLKKQQQEQAEQKRLAEVERKRLEEIERVKREEAEKKAREEAERKAREEAERQRKAEEQRKISEINSRTQGAFANSGSDSGGTGSGDGKSQGVTFPGGNQGVPTGDPNADKYGPGGSGSGNQGSGISFSLSGRSAKSLPKPNYPGDDSGIVVVKVTVDKYGNVTSAEPGVKGTTIANKSFWDEAKQAALKAKFNLDNNAPAFQQGTISYRFVLD
ncbi:cell envelope integrity protein TolA [uncultured Draconibacterium sp.]|uniref:cell envelope integrity protein TolA n=1 Tax=uncultured Draconibacterium sp. TaxID=1573823 RepID=UPI003216438A